MEPQEVLERALAAVDGAKIPADLREVGFTRAIDLIAFGGVPQASSANAAPEHAQALSSDTQATVNDSGVGSSDFYAAMSNATKVSESRLEHLIDIHEGAPIVAIRSSDLPTNSSKSQKIVGLLILVARHFYFNETETSLSEVLKECKRLNCDDQNFKRNIGKLPNLVVLGAGTAATAKVRKPFLESFTAELQALGIAAE